MNNILNDFFKKNSHILFFAIILLLINNSIGLLYLDLFLYLILHIIFVYLSFYHQNKINYFITFIISFFLDLILINNFGPHLLTFMFTYLTINKIRNFFINKRIIHLMIVQILIIIIMLISQKLLAFFLYTLITNINEILIMVITLTIIYYPIQIILGLFNKN